MTAQAPAMTAAELAEEDFGDISAARPFVASGLQLPTGTIAGVIPRCSLQTRRI